MSHNRKFPLIRLSPFVFVLLVACRNNKNSGDKNPLPVMTMAERVSEELEKNVNQIKKSKGELNDSAIIQYPDITDSLYENSHYQPLWSMDSHWLPLEDSLFNFIEGSKMYGLFPNDYHYRTLAFIHRVFLADSLGKKNAALWARADILLTDAFFRLVKDIKQGRLQYDSVTLRTDTILKRKIFINAFTSAKQSGDIISVMHALEPRYKGYDSLKTYLSRFLSKADFKPCTYLSYPYKDSVFFFKQLEKRLHELNELTPDMNNLDTIAFSRIIKKYQKEQGFKVTGKLSDPLVDQLNNTDWEKFNRIAINLDRYKLLPDTLPRTYLWVNLPSFMLRVMNNDTLVFQSRVIAGEPQTRTPVLTSEIYNFITYPQWTVPYSVIFKEMLPKIRENVAFLDKENLMVVDKNDSVLDPHTINWKKLNKEHFPYLIKQREGDNNSLGVIKFNFRNKYSVYMHDTNVRWLFGKSSRAFSHGCVRVKEWEKLADFLIRNDTLKYHPDSLRAWIGRQEKHTVTGFTKLPVYIRYFTCEGKDGGIKFYNDIYEEDRYLREKYFDNKTVD